MPLPPADSTWLRFTTTSLLPAPMKIAEPGVGSPRRPLTKLATSRTWELA